MDTKKLKKIDWNGTNNKDNDTDLGTVIFKTIF